MSYILHMKVEGFVSGLLVIQPAYSEKQFEELIKNRLPGGSQSSSVANGDLVLQRRLLEIVDQDVDLHIPPAADREWELPD